MNPPSSHIESNAFVVAVVGPTAVGKTALAEELAVRHGGEIISADSMQVYRLLDIGTAKPALHERRVPYHCIDLIDPDEPFSAALYQGVARTAINECHSRGVLPVICGGTGLYVRAALDALTFPKGEQRANPVRERYEMIARDEGPLALHALLASHDPVAAELIHPNNVRRVIRALEMAESGIQYSVHHAGLARRLGVYETRFAGLTMEREALYTRIHERVDAMLEAGLLAEVEALLRAGFREAITAAQAIGYKELVGVIDGTTNLADAVDMIKRASTRYAKRQLTWFRADPRVTWLDVTNTTLSEQVKAAEDALHLPAT